MRLQHWPKPGARFRIAIGPGDSSFSRLALGHDKRTSLTKLFTGIGICAA